MQQQGGQCPFCQLIANPEQLMTVGETENFYAWLEVNPRAKGHTMVVPKEHTESVIDLPPSQWAEAMNLTRKVVEKAEKGLGADGASVTINIEEAGGQMLPHAYIQVFPRFKDEETAGTPTGAVFPHREELQDQLQDIQEDMSSVSVDFGQETKEPHEESQKHLQESAVEKAARRATETSENTERKKRDQESKQKKEKKRKEPKEKEIPDPTKKEQEEEQETSEEQKEPENEEEDNTPRGEGHWDGKSFEWR